VTPHDARLAPAAGAAWMACASAWLGWGWWPVVCAAAVLAAGLGWRAARPAIGLAVVALVAGWLAGAAATDRESPVASALGAMVTIDAVAATDAAVGVDGATTGLWRVELSVVAVGDVPARATVIVWGEDDWKGVVRGDAVRLRGRLTPADGGVAAVLWRPAVVSLRQATGLDAAVASLRAGLRDATANLPERLRPLTRGMVIGDDSGMSPTQRAQMSAAGLTHLTAVSGSHFAIVLVAVTGVLRLVVRSRRVVAVATAATMGLLVCLVFPEPSVVRAATMAAAICLALWWGRPAQALPALCAGVTAVAVIDPRLACEPGFAMSAAAVAGIALWAPALAGRLGRVVPPGLAHPLAVCIAAQAAVLPLLALISAGVGPWSVAANLAVGWCAAPVTLLGLTALMVAPVSPAAAHAIATLAGWCAWPVDAAARAASSLPGSELSVPQGAWGAAASGLALAVAVALTFAARLRLGMPALAGVVVLGTLAAVVLPRLLLPAAPGDWLVVACDVGQGDGMLLRSGLTSAVVIDVGPADGPGPACLRRYGVETIDLLVITHPHADHEGAVPAVLDSVSVSAAWISPAEAEQPTASTRALEDAGVPITEVHTGAEATVGAVHVLVLAPDGDAVGEGSTGLNDASIVTLSTVAGVTVLGLGDLEHEGQRELARAIGPLVVDVVKVPHHGSDRQEPVLADLVTARIAVVSVGAGNPYGHPSPDAIRLWGARATIIERTDRCGDVVVVPGPALAATCPTGMAG
jgi:competence protein ComEC